jgi:hypothetical protein
MLTTFQFCFVKNELGCEQSGYISDLLHGSLDYRGSVKEWVMS